MRAVRLLVAAAPRRRAAAAPRRRAQRSSQRLECSAACAAVSASSISPVAASRARPLSSLRARRCTTVPLRLRPRPRPPAACPAAQRLSRFRRRGCRRPAARRIRGAARHTTPGATPPAQELHRLLNQATRLHYCHPQQQQRWAITAGCSACVLLSGACVLVPISAHERRPVGASSVTCISSRWAVAPAPAPARPAPPPRAAHTPHRRPRPRAPPHCARGPQPPASPTRAPTRPRPQPCPRAWPRPGAPAARRRARTRRGPARRPLPPLRLALPSCQACALPLQALLPPRAQPLHRARPRRAARRAPRWSLAGAAARRRWRRALAAPRARLGSRCELQELPVRLRPQLAPPLAAPERRRCPPALSLRGRARLAW